MLDEREGLGREKSKSYAIYAFKKKVMLFLLPTYAFFLCATYGEKKSDLPFFLTKTTIYTKKLHIADFGPRSGALGIPLTARMMYPPGPFVDHF